MAVVEQQELERTPQSRQQLSLGVSSLIGAAVVLFSLCFVLGGLPTLWESLLGVSADLHANRDPKINEFLSGALLLIVIIAVAVTGMLLLREADRAFAQPGLRAGVFFGAIALWLALGFATKIGAFMAPPQGEEFNVVAFGAWLVATFLLLGGVTWFFTRPGFGRWLIKMEERGWFHAVPYKSNQGWRVRVGTLFAILIIAGCGIYTIYVHKSLGSPYFDSPYLEVQSNSWFWDLPFSASAEGTSLYVPIMHQIQITVPILLFLGAVWLSWRTVNWPAFADFLIATEAEMNKVSWTTRRRLVQDTIVVLVTVFLFTTFLFVVDVVWIKVLSRDTGLFGLPGLGVLQVDIKSEMQKQQEKTQW